MIKILSLLFCLDAFASSKDQSEVIIQHTKGDVFMWDTSSAAWLPVKTGSNLTMGTLVQVASGSELYMILPNNPAATGHKGKEMHVEITSPIVIRLNETTFRRFEVENFYLSKTPQKLKAEGAEANPFLEFLEAWKRSAATLYNDLTSPKANDGVLLTENTLGKNGATVGVLAGKINVYMPGDGAVVVADNLPVETTIAWNPVPERNVSYSIYTWKRSEQKGDPIAVTKSTRHSARYASAGSYFIQVESVDGRWQSELQRIDIVPPGRLVSATNKNAKENDLSSASTIKLTSPPAGFQLFGASASQFVKFSWKLAHPANQRVMYQLIILNSKGEQIFQQRTSETSVVTTLPALGSMRWFVKAVVQEKNGKEAGVVLTSEKLNLTALRSPLDHSGVKEALHSNAKYLYIGEW